MLNVPFVNLADSQVTLLPLPAGRNGVVQLGASQCVFFAHPAPLDQFPPNLEEMVALSKLKVV